MPSSCFVCTFAIHNTDFYQKAKLCWLHFPLTLSTLRFCSRPFHLWIWSEPLFQIGDSVKNQNRMANSVYPDETDLHEPSHLDLLCLYWYLLFVCRTGRVNRFPSLPTPPPPPRHTHTHTHTQTTRLCRCQPNLTHAFQMSLACAALFFSGPNTWGPGQGCKGQLCYSIVNSSSLLLLVSRECCISW